MSLCLFQKSDLFRAFGVEFNLGLEINSQLGFLYLKLLVFLNQILTLFQQIVIGLNFFVFSFYFFGLERWNFSIFILLERRNDCHAFALFERSLWLQRLFDEFPTFGMNEFFWRETKIVSMVELCGGPKIGWFTILIWVFFVIKSAHKFFQSRFRIFIIGFGNIPLPSLSFSESIDGFVGAVLESGLFFGCV